MDFGTISYSTIASMSFNIIKKLILAWRNRRHTTLLLVNSDEIKKIIITFIERNSDYLIVDIDNVMTYLDFDEKEDVEKMKGNRVLFRRLIKKFQQYVMNEYADEKIIYITSSTDNLDLFKNKICFMPSKIYDTVKNTETDELYEMKTKGIKKVIYTSDTDILKDIAERFS